ncbi:hypothetical protein [Lacipirellula limnantheis]|uniref:Uncharacterized protein n=1 Tax=Lacipirellula limnantheis TaxID=2528024 RepID=A0A517TYI9_9BACT|nr:hypothetical protein [Lacipirellula limnantheis]QDT73434.1 hypothetical protein I41_26230 [Lacipirellula limnantheis]
MHVETKRRRPRALQAAQRWLAARLPPEELARLDRQGFVANEFLPSGARCAKLRYRDLSGRQRVAYIGVDQRLARRIAAYLAWRQTARRRRRTLNALQRERRRLLASVQARLLPHLDASSWHFHGRALRRRRGCARHGPRPALDCGTNVKGKMMSNPISVTAEQPPGPTSAPSDERHDPLRRWAQQQASPIGAALGWLTADVCELTAKFAAPLKAELRDAATSPENLGRVADDLRQYSQLSRQAERCLRLTHELEKANACETKLRPVDTYGGRSALGEARAAAFATASATPTTPVVTT